MAEPRLKVFAFIYIYIDDLVHWLTSSLQTSMITALFLFVFLFFFQKTKNVRTHHKFRKIGEGGVCHDISPLNGKKETQSVEMLSPTKDNL